MYIKTLSIILSILMISCGNASDSNLTYAKTSNESGGFLYDEEQSEPKESSIERKLIIEGSLSFETKDLELSRKHILEAVQLFNGYISSDQETSSTYALSNDLTVRIPSESLESFISAATKGVKKFDHKSINSRDVTEQFFDLSARLKTNKELENRFLEILSKANKVDELLQVERELGRIRAEIESQEGRLKLMNNKIAFSTLSIHFYKKISKPVEYGEKFANGFKNGWKNLIQFFIGIVNLWPFVIIFLIGIFFLRRWRKNKS